MTHPHSPTRRLTVLAFASLLLAIACPSAQAAEADLSAPAPHRTLTQPEDITVPDILQRLENIGPYELPDLPLKTNVNYAHSSSDVEPFGGVKPFK